MSDQPNKDKEDNKSEDQKEGDASLTAPKSFFNEWLEKLQQESWQLELLISGLALYLVWETRAKLDKLDSFVALNPGGDFIGTILDFLQVLAWGAWAIFIINLLIHIAMRGLWIGAIGLRYVSGDIDYKDLHYSEIFENFLRRRVGRFDSFIEQLERACSVIFAYTFLLFFIFLSLLMTVLVPLIIIYPFRDMLDSQGDAIWLAVFLMIYSVMGFVYMIDFISLGGIKKIKDKTISRIYFFIYLGFSVITLSFLYRPLLYNFIDHRYSRRLLWMSLPYFAIVFLITPHLRYNAYAYFPFRYVDLANDYEETSQDRLVINWAYYEDLRKEFLIKHPYLPAESRIINSATLDGYIQAKENAWLFLRIRPEDDGTLEKLEHLPKQWKTGLRHPLMFDPWEKDTNYIAFMKPFHESKNILLREKRKKPEKYTAEEWTYKKDSLEELSNLASKEYIVKKEMRLLDAHVHLYEVQIDSIPYLDSLFCRYYMHPNMGEKGLLCNLPLGALEPGEHLLELNRKKHFETSDTPARDSFRLSKVAEIPFIIR